ncbi:MAG: hypothetical protein ACFFCQ_02695 [Promethearchaeota archaeon]
MNKKAFLVLIPLFFLFNSQFSSVMAGGTFICKKGDVPPTIDGQIGATEYGDPANLYTIELSNGTYTSTASLYLLHDGIDLYAGFIIGDKTNATESGTMDFLNFMIHINSTALDWKMGGNLKVFGATYVDFYASGGPPDSDENDGGSTDGSAAFTYVSETYIIEMSFPLNSTDDDHDFSAEEGDTVPLFQAGIFYSNDSIFGGAFYNSNLNDTANWFIDLSSIMVTPEINAAFFVVVAIIVAIPVILMWKKKTLE